MVKFINISKLCKILDLIDPITKKPLNHVLRYWEKKFDQIKPKKINNRRYYSPKDVELIRNIKFLIKDKKISISGIKIILNSNTKKLDVDNNFSLKNEYLLNKINVKSKNLLKKIYKLKKYGKKNSS